MAATLMQALDSTIANVALPYMQGSLSASYDQITWVLTSYIIAAAIMTAPVGWLSARFGQKTACSWSRSSASPSRRCCAASPASLGEMVMFRLLQGRVRRRAGAAVAGHHAEHLPAGAARLGDGDLGHGGDGRADPGPDARRLSDRILQLALRVLRQPAVRGGGDRGLWLFLPARAAALRVAVRLVRVRAAGASASPGCN